VRAIEQVPADLVASDCPLAGLQLDQAGPRHTREASDPPSIQIVRDAYGCHGDVKGREGFRREPSLVSQLCGKGETCVKGGFAIPVRPSRFSSEVQFTLGD